MSTLAPFPCGAPRPPSVKFPGYADAKGVFAHYRACGHPACQERQAETTKLRLAIARSVGQRQRKLRKFISVDDGYPKVWHTFSDCPRGGMLGEPDGSADVDDYFQGRGIDPTLAGLCPECRRLIERNTAS